MTSTETHKCANCGQDVPAENERRFTNLYYHAECYRCKKCDKELEKERPFNNNHAPICSACHDNLRYPTTSEGAYFQPIKN